MINYPLSPLCQKWGGSGERGMGPGKTHHKVTVAALYVLTGHLRTQNS